jgi:isopentenyl-diphosphate delta-isomerase
MGLDAHLEPAGLLSYSAPLTDGWYENEIVHLFIGRTNADPAPDPAEVGGWRRVAANRLAAECAGMPDMFTAWFNIYLERVPKIALLRA